MIAWGQDFGNSLAPYPVARERTAGGSLLATQILSDVDRVTDIQVGLGGGVAAVDWRPNADARIWTAVGP